jgi:hypothetical protein
MTYTTDHTTTPTSDARDVDIWRHRYTEAKDGFKTSEFYVMAAFVAAVLFATGGASRPSPWSPTSSAAASPSWVCDTPPTTSKTGVINSETATAAPFPSKGNGAAAYSEAFASHTQQSVAWQVARQDPFSVTWNGEKRFRHIAVGAVARGEVMRITKGCGRPWHGRSCVGYRLVLPT